jgi:hypothetical protein
MSSSPLRTVVCYLRQFYPSHFSRSIFVSAVFDTPPYCTHAAIRNTHASVPSHRGGRKVNILCVKIGPAIKALLALTERMTYVSRGRHVLAHAPNIHYSACCYAREEVCAPGELVHCYSTFLVSVPTDVISLQLHTSKIQNFLVYNSSYIFYNLGHAVS